MNTNKCRRCLGELDGPSNFMIHSDPIQCVDHLRNKLHSTEFELATLQVRYARLDEQFREYARGILSLTMNTSADVIQDLLENKS